MVLALLDTSFLYALSDKNIIRPRHCECFELLP
ncbi:Uncharacterised protein [Candidatus Venteria ishoeyi]|uniref:Uncharacterized protein n=1 Tax=Candidatus Venteria ishoeyi TaxID=1899563 RepID=A0A1H6FG09_9GAMM|nr:Uncharacterised protein [Candidatus Venteria ishoeyi]